MGTRVVVAMVAMVSALLHELDAPRVRPHFITPGRSAVRSTLLGGTFGGAFLHRVPRGTRRSGSSRGGDLRDFAGSFLRVVVTG